MFSSVSRVPRVVLACLALAAAGCGGNPFGFGEDESKDSDQAKKEKPQIVIPVEAELPTRGTISAYHDTWSRVEAERTVQVTAEGQGLCREVLVDEGDTVVKGQVLAELNKEEARAALGEAEVQLRQAKADYDRKQEIHANGLLSDAELDAARFAYEQALETVRSRKVQLENQTIRAPWTGLITQREIQQGAMVSSGTHAYTMVDPASYVLAITVPERIISEINVGQPANVQIDSVPDKTFSATVRRINPGIDRETGKVKVLLDFEDEASQYLRDAAFSRVQLVMDSRENALLVPKDAVLEENTRKYVFVVREAEEDAGASEETVAEETREDDDGEPGGVLASPPDPEELKETEIPLTAVRADIEVGLEDSQHYEVVSGLTDTDLVVTNGHHSLVSTREGTRVRVTNATDEILKNAGFATEELLETAEEKRKETVERDGRHRRHGR